MAKVSAEQKFDMPAEKVWEMIGKFSALADWHPAVETCELSGDGSMRTLKLAGGGEIVEKLEKLDDGAYEYSYSIVDSPLPVSNYVSTLRIKERAGDTCVVEWGSHFNPAGASVQEAEDVVRGIYQAGFDNLQKMFKL